MTIGNLEYQRQNFQDSAPEQIRLQMSMAARPAFYQCLDDLLPYFNRSLPFLLEHDYTMVSKVAFKHENNDFGVIVSVQISTPVGQTIRLTGPYSPPEEIASVSGFKDALQECIRESLLYIRGERTQQLSVFEDYEDVGSDRRNQEGQSSADELGDLATTD